MNKSETITKIAPALLKAQKATHVAVKGAKNPFYKSTYADLESVINACKKPLNDNGISVLQSVGYIDTTGGIKTCIETTLLHESGEFISDVMIVTMDKEGPQAQGSAISYAKRYSLQSLILLPSADDDAESATDRTPKAEVRQMIPTQKKKLESLSKELPVARAGALNNAIKKGMTFDKAKESIELAERIIAEQKSLEEEKEENTSKKEEIHNEVPF